MSFLDALWVYQQADLKVDQYEAEIRQNPTRKKLVRLRNYYKEQQDAMRAVESGTSKAASSLEQAQEQLALLNDTLNKRESVFSQEDFTSSGQLKARIDEIASLISRLNQLKQRIDEMARQCQKLGADLKAARANASKAKNDYAQIKDEYDAEFAVQSKKLDELKAERDRHVSGVPQDALQKYQAIKLRCTPAMALLDGDKCSGCNMSLPALLLSNARKADRIVECETCGRIIYIK